MSGERSMFGCHGGGATQNISITVKSIVIHGGPGAYSVKVRLSIGQWLAALVGRAPTNKQIESWVRTEWLGETEPKQIARR